MADEQQDPGEKGGKNAQMGDVISAIENYSRLLVANFEKLTQQVRERLNDGGLAAVQALKVLASTREDMQRVISLNSMEFEQLMTEVEAVTKEFDGIDALQNEVLQLSDLLTTVEQTVKCG
jgi:uncharacterized protein YciW